MKLIAIINFVLVCTFVNGQGVGTIKVEVFKSNDCELDNNEQLDSILVSVSGIKINSPVEYLCVNGRSPLDYPNLHSGKYSVKCTTLDGKTITVDKVEVSAEKITFLPILIEPECDLNFFQKRKRRKKYVNY